MGSILPGVNSELLFVTWKVVTKDHWQIPVKHFVQFVCGKVLVSVDWLKLWTLKWNDHLTHWVSVMWCSKKLLIIMFWEEIKSWHSVYLNSVKSYRDVRENYQGHSMSATVVFQSCILVTFITILLLSLCLQFLWPYASLLTWHWCTIFDKY